MAEKLYRHIFLQGPTGTQRFTSPRTGGGTVRNPTRNRIEHSAFLRQRLEQAWRDAEQRQAVTHAQRDGTYIEFVSEPGFDLALRSLENLKSGIRLLNVQRRGEQDDQQTLATVYVPHNQRAYFLEKVKKYAEENTPKKGLPKNAGLIQRISDIRLSVLESFWQDRLSLLPGDAPEWIEVWLSSDSDHVIGRFNDSIAKLGIQRADGALKFPERSVEVILADRSHLQSLIEGSDDVAEFRAVPTTAAFFIEQQNKEQLAAVQALLARSQFVAGTDVAVCILDAGVNNGHPLIQPVLDDSDLHTARADWGSADHDGHGTLMAGVAAYGDLLAVVNSSGPIRVLHRLESAKILPPPPAQNPKELWGYLTAQGLLRAEIKAPSRKRITCMAITSTDERDRGRPSSWSGMMDVLASGYQDDTHRLIILSGGNIVDANSWLNYPADNRTNEIHDPGQAWNVLTVGAFTEKVQIADPTLSNYTPIAPAGGLSPFSTTSTTWPPKWPIKPELVLEGGNAARGPNNSIQAPDEMQLLSTYYDPQTAQFAPFGATSAASAQAARMAAQIQAQYPNAWQETIRALMVHAANWTDGLKSQFLPPSPTKTDYARLLRICGYGVPDLDNALYCAANSLTLISQAELQPFDRTKGGGFVTRDMHLYKLPWPFEILSGLAETKISMRVTLSYFVEPGPGEIGWDDRYRYPSHGLRFEVNGPSESEDDFIRRVNKQARDEGERPTTRGPGDRWVIGSNARNVGSIHSDIWEGPAVDLAASNMIAIYPTVGWWRERHHLGRWNKRCRYSLIVSIHTPHEDVDIYTPVILQIGIPIEIQAIQ